jgi:hypothetical protein
MSLQRKQCPSAHPTTCPRCDGPADALVRFDGLIGEPYELVRFSNCGKQERVPRVAKPAQPRPRKRRSSRGGQYDSVQALRPPQD